MADLARIKRNVAKMASMNAPEADIDGYIASEGVTVDDVRNYGKDYTLGRLGTIDRGLTFGLGRKAGGLINAIGSYPVDRVAQLFGVKNTPSFMDRYHEIVDPTMQAIEQYHEDKPAEAFALELGAGLANPANKIGLGYISKGTGLANKAARAAGVGGAVGGVAGGLNAERVEDVAPNAFGGSVGGAVLGGAFPLAAGGIGKVVNTVRNARNPQAMTSLAQMVEAESLKNAINEAQRTGRSILEVGDDSILQAAQKVRQQTPEARQILSQRMQAIAEAQPARTEGVINEALGSQGKNATIRQVAEAARQKAQPIYKELEDIGDLAKYEIENKSRKNIGFDDTVRDVNGDELFKNLTLYADNKPVGYIDYSVYDDKPYIEMIKVLDGEKRKGYGTELIKQLQRQYPDNEIDFGMMTDEGSALYKSLQKNIKTNPEYVKYEKKLANSNKKLKEYSDILDRVTGEETGKEQDKIIKAADAWQKEHWKNEDYKDWLENNWKQKTFIDTNPKEVESQLSNAIKNNDVLSDTISRVKRANSSLKNLPDTDFRVVNEARKALSQASLNRTDISGHEARMALNELDPMLEKIIPTYKEARGIYENAHQFENAADIGRDVFNARQSPDDFNAIYGGLSASEKQAARIGLRDELMNKIGSSVNETSALNKFLPKNVREKIVTIAGKTKGEKIIDEAEQAVKLRRNINKIFNGSPTSSNQSLRDMAGALRRFVKNPWDTTINSLLSPYDNIRNVRVADALTSRDLAALLQQTAPQNIDFSRASQITPYIAQLLAQNQ